MEGLIIDLVIEYIALSYELKSSSQIYTCGGKRAYHEQIIDNLVKAFLIDRDIADGYLIDFILNIDEDFNWHHFKHELKPRFTLTNEILLHYMDVIYDNEVRVAEGFRAQANRNNWYYMGVDPANDDMAIALMYGLNHGLNHPVTPIDNAIRRIAEQTFNLDITPIPEDLEE